ncbi:MAG: cysteine--tRNA ligase [Bacteroidota bacterium]
MALYDQYPISVYNSLTNKKENFETIEPGHVGMYVCGPTVYSDVHLGNVRTFLSFDVIFRYLKFLGHKVRYVRNITDVGHLTDDADDGEDKIAKKARLEKLEPMEVAYKYTTDFHNVLNQFNLLPPSIEPSATGHIMEQIEMVKDLIDNGLAYEMNGSVYFDVNKYNETNDYGKLSGRVLEELQASTRDLDSQDEKRNKVDFALWKNASPEHIMRWDSPWGKGFPGWHLECSVMSTKYLGEQFDIHGGGMDLKFPHHECEIAQCKGARGKDPANYWIHTNMLTVNGQKMSKSLNNSFLPRELFSGDHPLLDRGYSPMTVRFFMLQSHYSSTLDFSNTALGAAEKGYKKLMAAVKTARSLSYTEVEKVDDSLEKSISDLIDQLYANMSDDFNTAKTLAVLFDLAGKINDFSNRITALNNISKDLFEKLTDTFERFVIDVLGLKEEEGQNNDVLDGTLDILISLRKKAKEDRNYALSDKIREDLREIGIILKDEKDGNTSYTLA